MVFEGSLRLSEHLLNLPLDMGPHQGYLPDRSKLIYIEGLPDQEDVAKSELESEGLHLNFVGKSQYLGSYLGHRE